MTRASARSGQRFVTWLQLQSSGLQQVVPSAFFWQWSMPAHPQHFFISVVLWFVLCELRVGIEQPQRAAVTASKAMRRMGELQREGEESSRVNSKTAPEK